MSCALDLVPDNLLQKFSDEVRKLFAEIFASYAKAMKRAILEYILRSPDERKRLHIVLLPR
jgi:dynein heavy chain